MSEVLVDSSVWIEFFRGSGAPEVDILDALLADEAVCTTGLIKAEIIPSARASRESQRIREGFEALPLVTEPPNIWDIIIEWRLLLRSKGIHGIGIPDLIVAAVAKANDRFVFARDRHFKLMKDLIGLRILEY